MSDNTPPPAPNVPPSNTSATGTDGSRGQSDSTPSDLIGTGGRTVLGIYFLILPVVLCTLAVVLWPVTTFVESPARPGQTVSKILIAEWLNIPLSLDLA